MTLSARIAQLPERGRRGSRVRCLLLTEGTREEVASRLTRLASPWAVVDAGRHTWLPMGLGAPTEAKLGETPTLLSPKHREAVTTWWLTVRERANTPNWDIASTATIEGREGLLLVEAKAHAAELKTSGKDPASNAKNHSQIGAAIAEASEALNRIRPDWGLSRDSHYQLANRFAWSWKLASLGVPVVLVYLGFLNAQEMSDQGVPFDDSAAWETIVREHGAKRIPDSVWREPLLVGSTPLRALIRSMQWGLPQDS